MTCRNCHRRTQDVDPDTRLCRLCGYLNAINYWRQLVHATETKGLPVD